VAGDLRDFPRLRLLTIDRAVFPGLTGNPLIGVNYTHLAFPRCSLNGTGILATYYKPNVARTVHAQLFQMAQVRRGEHPDDHLAPDQR